MQQALVRLLGPHGPEIGCDECFARLDVYVELELAHSEPDARMPGFAAHLAGCPACREDYKSLKALVGGKTAP
jgi:hypothetical protein